MGRRYPDSAVYTVDRLTAAPSLIIHFQWIVTIWVYRSLVEWIY